MFGSRKESLKRKLSDSLTLKVFAHKYQSYEAKALMPSNPFTILFTTLSIPCLKNWSSPLTISMIRKIAWKTSLTTVLSVV